MLLARSAAVLALSVALVSEAGAATRADSSSLKAPTGVHAFLLRADEPAADAFSRTPAFAWSPVKGATRYLFRVGTSTAPAPNAEWWSGETKVPALSLPVALPWITGEPHALYAQVRGIGLDGSKGPWSKPFGFDVRWTSTPAQEDAAPGLLRWTTVDGATAYEVWYLDAGRLVRTSTNVADEREYYGPDAIAGPVHWRVRAVREIYNRVSNGVPAASHGPWSPVYTSAVADPAAGTSTPESTVSDVVSRSRADGSHHLMPGFAFDGDASLDGTTAAGHRVYVSTDRDCVNTIFRGEVVGSPAYAPRVSDTPFSGVESDSSATTTVPRDLWDNDWTTGGYYWTVVAVDAASGDNARELDVPQDACTAGHVGTFRRTSDPAVASNTHVPYAAGLSPSGRLLAATHTRPRFYGTPLVSWQPALAATSYEVQWSKTSSFAPVAGRLKTRATSAVLPLAPGTWWYRVRGLNPGIPAGSTAMNWSRLPASLVVAKPTFRVVG
jgi:hypothetical protein